MQAKSIFKYTKDLLSIAAPIIMGNLGFILIGVGDVIVAGRHSTDTFAAISIAAAIVNCIMTLAIGMTSAISPLLSNYRGENKAIKKYFYPSVRFALTLGGFSSLIILLFIPLIPVMGFEKQLIFPVQQYMFISALSTFGGALHHSMKEFLQAFEIVVFPNILTMFCVFLNFALNIIFVFGWGFIPSMGVAGLAIASFIVRYFMGFALYFYCHKRMNLYNYSEKGYYKNLIKIGLPISMAVLIEFVAFNSIAILLGRIAGIYAAAQNLVCTIITVSFMIPFAISNAIAVKVGFANGAKNYTDLKNYSYMGIILSFGFIFFNSAILSLFPEFILSIFTKDAALVKIVMPLIILLVIFQFFDGLQTSLAGICKGIKQTKIVTIANFLAYWGVSIPIGCYLGLKLNMKLLGFWIGLFAGSIILCIIMALKLRKYLSKSAL